MVNARVTKEIVNYDPSTYQERVKDARKIDTGRLIHDDDNSENNKHKATVTISSILKQVKDTQEIYKTQHH